MGKRWNGFKRYLAQGRINNFWYDVPEEYGGMGLDDYRYNTILIEEN